MAKNENLNNVISNYFDINYKYPLLRNVHLKLSAPTLEGITYLTRGADVIYYHYGCDGQHDIGWGCKILHIPQADDLKKYANILKKYFEDYGGFVMMGGDMDAASKGIAGIHISGNQA